MKSSGHLGDKFVCADCLDDSGLKSYIRENATSTKCSYCEKVGEAFIAVETAILFQKIVRCIRAYYEMAEGRAVASPEQLTTPDSTEQLLSRHRIVDDPASPLSFDIEQAINQEGSYWVERQSVTINQYQVLQRRWEDFQESVLHEFRYTYIFLNKDSSTADIADTANPKIILHDVGKCVESLGLIKTLALKTPLFRARAHATELFRDVTQLGTAPIRTAKWANRMSPAGIPMFYAADSKELAISEVRETSKDEIMSIGTFLTTRKCRILDLTELKDVPSIYSRRSGLLETETLFMQEFVHNIAKPITKDGSEHVDYVPSQIVTEYFRHVFRTEKNDSIHGICYPSSLEGGGKAYVFFWGHDSDRDRCQFQISDWCALESAEHRQLKAVPPLVPS